MSDTQDATTQQTRSITTTAGFSLTDRKIKCEHNFQLYVDFGTTTKGPWVKVGLNEVEYGIGYLPQAAMPKPNLAPVPDISPVTT